ncbi:hypothetical protein LTR78_001919 [Recurvomyces mirabilis]|uniref:Uncharacterized protein n=1 Tax=Recurvomyces mirabilis TaxID=574656 RepID=A0AAE1C5D4_9PEZI|nr:hypothetical protein LTR78_001919 [Recurvomyces mirabilis]KAK5156642.1 hypothetical protein LTS14_004854 [Recurvomyces mirabilis]
MTNAYYFYNPARPLTEAEQDVRNKGYNYVSTTILEPHGKLQEHRHSSHNTHEIIRGSLKADKMHKGSPTFRAIFQLVGKVINLPAHVDYQGEAGLDGCDFVEGHMVLSPTTAERFEARGMIVKASKGTEGAFPVTE